MTQGLSGPEQVDVWEQDATDPRPRAASGWAELDAQLRRQSFGPGTLAFLAGRMHTRKTAVAMNLIRNMLTADVPVGLVGIDEAPFMYVSKLASVQTQRAHTELDDEWLTAPSNMVGVRSMYESLTRKFSMTHDTRPSLDDLARWIGMEEVRVGERMRVLFIDYLSLLERGKYAGKEADRIPRLCEELQVFSNREQLTVVALHQVGRQDDSALRRYHGSTPITPEQLMYGGEQQADIILATYRPALDPIGNLSQSEAISQGIDLADWQLRADRVVAFQHDTMLQLIKNRPGIHLDPQGIRLRSVGDSQKMEVVP